MYVEKDICKCALQNSNFIDCMSVVLLFLFTLLMKNNGCAVYYEISTKHTEHGGDVMSYAYIS